MRIYKEDVIQETQHFATRVHINNVELPGQMVGPHWHDYYEVLYIMDGVALQTIEGKSAEVSSGDIVLIQPGEVHMTRCLSEDGCGIIVMLFFPSCLNLDNQGNLYSRYLNLFLDSSSQGSGFLHSPYPHQREMLRVMSRISEEYTLAAKGYQLIAKGLLYEFLGYLQRIGGVSLHAAATHSRYLEIVKACRYIEEHYNESLSLAALANRTGYTKEYFSALFKEVVGQNFKAFLDFVRISEAQKLLASRDYSVAEIAERVGYASLSSFSRAFKRMKGHSPSKPAESDNKESS
ncbi:MAG: helix-turn-helix domain-containing protein [Oscillospiraceae bacterium]